MHRAALGGCEWPQNGVRESEGVVVVSTLGDKASSVFSLTKQWSVQQLETKTEKTYINPKVLVALLIN